MAAQRKKVLQRSETYKRAREEVEKLGKSAREWRRDRAVMMRDFLRVVVNSTGLIDAMKRSQCRSLLHRARIAGSRIRFLYAVPQSPRKLAKPGQSSSQSSSPAALDFCMDPKLGAALLTILGVRGTPTT